MDKNDGDPITIKGIVTDIDEFNGYSMNIEDIYTVKAVGLSTLQNYLNKDENPYLGKDIEILGKISKVGGSTIGENNQGMYIYIEPNVEFPGEKIKIKCFLTTDEQIDMIQNANGRERITVQGKLTNATEINTLEVKYITKLKY